MFELRDYQSEAIEKAYERIGQGHRPIVCAPTGSGKTVIAAAMARDAIEQGKRVLWMTGREEIIRQAYRTFSELCGIQKVGVLCAGLAKEVPWWFYPPVTLASWDTLKARWDKSPMWRIPADRVLIDEAHLSLSPKMAASILPFYAEREVIGFTATPARRSGRGLGTFYTRIIQVRRVRDIIADGYLAAPEYWAGKHADTSMIGHDPKTGDFKENELAAAHRDGVLIGDVIDNWLRIARDRRTIVFAVDIAHAQALTERFQAVDVTAACIHSKMTAQLRQAISEQFRRGDVQVLVNVGIATYGYDVPEIRCVVVARPTKSIVLWHQMVGRGLRPKPDGDYCIIIDHGDNVRRLGCVEDEIRWRLDEGKEAAVNTTRLGDESRGKKPEAPPTECEQCHHVFSRSRVCPKCGWEKPASSRDIETIEADLVRVRSAQSTCNPEPIERRTWYLMVRGWAEMNGKNPGMAYHRYREKFREAPPLAWNRMSSLEPDARVKAEMHKAMQNYARRMSYAKRRGEARAAV